MKKNRRVTEIVKSAKWEKKPRLWRCSSLGQCPRRHYWQRLDIDPDPDYEINQEAFDVGNAIHELYQKRLRQAGVMVAHELYMESDSLSGHSDGLLYIDGELRVLDIKSTAKNLVPGFTKSGKAKRCLTEPEPWHIAQVYGYQKLYWDMEIKPMVGSILYISKDNRRGVDMAEFEFPLTEDTYLQVQNEVSKLDDYWESKTVPPKEPCNYAKPEERERLECMYCPYKQKCDKT